MRYLKRFLAWFRTEATTVGISPKILGSAIGTGLTALLSLVGVTPGDIGNLIGVDSTVVAGAMVLLSSTLATALLSPGKVVHPERVDEPGNDELLDPHVKDLLEK